MGARLKILISAYACEPNRGSEQEVGWQWAMHLAKFVDILVVTRANDRDKIERELAKFDPAVPVPKFEFIEAGGWQMKLKKYLGHRWYYNQWQKSLRHRMPELIRRYQPDILHHITFASYRYDTAIEGHSVPTIWGPVGGAEMVPEHLLPPVCSRAGVYERIRNWMIGRDFKFAGKLQRRLEAYDLVISSTGETRVLFSTAGHVSELFPTIGLEMEKWRPALGTKENGSQLKILYVGNLTYLKGVHWLIAAIEKLPTKSVQLSLVGSGEMEGALRQQISQAGIEDQVTLLGRIPLDKIPDVYAEHDLFIFPSLHDSGGFAVIEAMASGLPVICFDCGGPAISVRDHCGIRIQLDHNCSPVTGLSDAIQSYVDDPELRLRHGESARNFIEKNYDWKHKAERMVSLYRMVLNDRD